MGTWVGAKSPGRELWDVWAITGADADETGEVLLICTGWSRPAAVHGNDPHGCNREHLWAKSRGDLGTSQLNAGEQWHHER